MNKVLGYTVEDLKMVFNRIRSMDEKKSCYWFTVTVDGTEITPMTDELNRFNDFMLYDLSGSHELVFNLYHDPERLADSYKFFLQGKDQWEIYLKNKNDRLKNENGALKSENKTLQRTIRKQDRKKYYEKVEGIKAVDAGEFIVLFVSKKEIDIALGDQLQQAREGVNTLERVERIFHRFIHPTKNE